MKIGLIGLPATGKTTFFRLLTGANGNGAAKGFASRVGVAQVPDERIDFLSGLFCPRKVTLATMETTDLRGIASTEGDRGKGSPLLDAVRHVDALVHVVRAFEEGDIPHAEGTIDPLRDMETVNMELLFADLAVIENRMRRIEEGRKANGAESAELAVLQKCREGLERDRLLHRLDLTPEERACLRSFQFFTGRPMILLLNLDENQFRSGRYPRKTEVHAYAEARGLPLLEICAQTEWEISELAEEDREPFLEDLRLAETGTARLARAAYRLLDLVSFFTVGQDEVKAWPVRRGATAWNAAGKIHSDIQRGFIRAEVVGFEDFQRDGSLQQARSRGHVRLEGRDYVVSDGDIIDFRFHV